MCKKIVQGESEEKKLINAYLSGKSASELAKEYRTQTRVISMTLKRCGVKIRTLSESCKIRSAQYPNLVKYLHTEAVRKKLSENHADFSGDKNPNFKGKGAYAPDGVWLTFINTGYLRRKDRKHPLSSVDGYISEHVYQACLKYGVESVRGKIVHHINGIRDDNRPENLIALGIAEHMRLEHKIRKEKLSIK